MSDVNLPKTLQPPRKPLWQDPLDLGLIGSALGISAGIAVVIRKRSGRGNQ